MMLLLLVVSQLVVVVLFLLLTLYLGARAWQAAIKAAASPDIHYLSTEGFYNISLGGSLHPTGANDVAQIAPKIANKLRPLLFKSVLTARGEL